MILDLTHNKLIKDTVTDGFKTRFEASVVPKLRERYGDNILGVQMYEDYIKDNLASEGYWYYPLTVVTDKGPETLFIRWSIIGKGDFEGGVPYAFVGYSLDFEICDEVPEEISAKVGGTVKYFDGNAVKLTVNTTHPDKTFLSGKYSQSFIDEMAKQLTVQISRVMEISGLEGSGVELSLVFTPETYMEHTSENKTYRRLLMSAKGAAPKDFWIKWTRLDGEGAYSVKDEPEAGNIRFEIGEDVPQKIREKEYRFLVYGNSDKYRVAMGRKNIVEWREIIKRALKRGELAKLEAEPAPEVSSAPEVEAAPVSETVREEPRVTFSDPQLSDKLMEILAKCGMSAPSPVAEEPKEETEPQDNSEFDEAMRIARMAAGIEEPSEAPEEESELLEQEQESEEPEIEEEQREENPLDSFAILDEEQETLAHIQPEPLEISLFEAETEEEAEEEEAKLEEEPELEAEGQEEIAEPENEEEVEFEQQTIEEPVSEEPIEELGFVASAVREKTPEEELLERLTREAEALRLREEELARRELKLREENERIAALVREAEEEKLRIQEQRIKEEKAREREKALYAEAARLAIEENERKRLELEEREAARAAEEARLEELRRAEEERIRLESEKAAEIARIEAEVKVRAEERFVAEQRAKDAMQRFSESARSKAESAMSGMPSTEAAREQKPAEPAPSPKYTYTSKLVRLMFRHKVDPNVTSKIHELISSALGYFHKEHVYIKVKASITKSSTVVLNFVKIPEEEIDLLIDIIKILGNSDLGISKIIME